MGGSKPKDWAPLLNIVHVCVFMQCIVGLCTWQLLVGNTVGPLLVGLGVTLQIMIHPCGIHFH